jgi:AcrR family transcriptional regulator
MGKQRAESRTRFPRIPRGQQGLTPELVSADQRARLNAAMVQVAAGEGYLQSTVEDVLARAAVSRRTFYEHYDNKQQCFLAALDDVLGDWWRQAVDATRRATGGKGPPRALTDRLRLALRTLFALVERDPLGAQMIFVESLNCGSAGLRRLEQTVDELEGTVAKSFETPHGRPALPRAIATVIIGGVLEIITLRLRHERTGELAELVEPLVEWMRSYGSAEAPAALDRARADLIARELAQDQAHGSDQPGPPLWRDQSARPIAVRDARSRIIDAAAQIASDCGYAALSINAIDRVAGVSHHTFRHHFRSKEEAFIAAYRIGGQETVEHSLQAFLAASSWEDAVHAGLAAELRFLASRPALARIGFLEVYAAGPEGLRLREIALHSYTAALEPGLQQAGRSADEHKVIAEAIAGGIFQLMRECLLHHDPDRLPSLAPEATYAALAPFVGAKAAASVAARPISSPTGA